MLYIRIQISFLCLTEAGNMDRVHGQGAITDLLTLVGQVELYIRLGHPRWC